jgi:hypothetical protein
MQFRAQRVAETLQCELGRMIPTAEGLTEFFLRRMIRSQSDQTAVPALLEALVELDARGRKY